jgi:hypothetical protein
MKVITHKRHHIYFNDKEVKKMKSLCRKNKITMNKLAQELGIQRFSLWRKFARKQPFLYLEFEKLDYLGVLYVEKHEQIEKLRSAI